LLTLVAGIRPETPGFKRVLIAPHLGQLNSLKAAMPHPGGLIRVWYTRSRSTIKTRIELPPGLTGKFKLGRRERPLHSGMLKFAVPLTAQ
jgi:alpha-L-rhamnosidase